MNEYNKEFYSNQMAGSISSAKRIVPYLMDMLSPVRISSVVDFGCGVGGWLNQFQKVNPDINVLGLDFGNPDRTQLQISLNDYKKADLSKKICLDKKFDLCISLEVAEHINSESADIFLDNLCRHADFILFSAAIPGQGGTEHVNEQPLSYWVKKFKKRGYKLYDIIRPAFWGDKNIDVWYRQNTVLFIKNDAAVGECRFRKEPIYYMIMDIAHPELVSAFRKRQNDCLINKTYIRIHHRKLFSVLSKMKHVIVSWGGAVRKLKSCKVFFH